MKRISTLLTVAAAGLTAFSFSSCGTSHTVNKPLSGGHPGGPVYTMGTCVSTDEDATAETCNELKEQVHYALLKRGLYAKNPQAARRKVNLTITYFRDVGAWARAWSGVMTGKDGLDARIDVIDKQSGKVLGSATASTFNLTAANTTEGTMTSVVAEELADFVASGGR